MISSNPNLPTFSLDDFELHWQMTRCEKYAFYSLLQSCKPDVAIEIGTYKGGSLQVISKFAKKVYSVDISPDCKTTLGDKFSNVEFRTGKSHEVIPEVLKEIDAQGRKLEFVLIDGDHSTEGVKGDINLILQYKPKAPLYIVFHDSFNPVCRKGILAADWQKSDYVHYVELDFIPGVFHYDGFDTAVPRSMYGGFTVALMRPEKRKGELVIHQSQQGLYNTVFNKSIHKKFSLFKWYYKLKKIMGRK